LKWVRHCTAITKLAPQENCKGYINGAVKYF